MGRGGKWRCSFAQLSSFCRYCDSLCTRDAGKWDAYQGKFCRLCLLKFLLKPSSCSVVYGRKLSPNTRRLEWPFGMTLAILIVMVLCVQNCSFTCRKSLWPLCKVPIFLVYLQCCLLVVVGMSTLSYSALFTEKSGRALAYQRLSKWYTRFSNPPTSMQPALPHKHPALVKCMPSSLIIQCL